MSSNPEVYECFEASTATWQYIVADLETHHAVIIDSVLDLNPSSSQISTETADGLLLVASKNNLKITRILETHAHADHLTAAYYLQQRLIEQGMTRPDICIGARITEVQATFSFKYEIDSSEVTNVFDKYFLDNEEFTIGSLSAQVLHLPGHTPDHVGYRIGEYVFTGDSIFNPDVGSARADFPGGCATTLYNSAKILLDLPGNYRLYVGHDYPPDSRIETSASRKHKSYTTVEEQNKENKHVKAGTSNEEFVKLRLERDSKLGEPRLLHHALQFNIRAGKLPKASAGNDMFLHIPIKASKELVNIMQKPSL